MKTLFISIGLLVVTGTMVSCSSQKKGTTSTQITEQKEMEVTGEIVKIENGKDGYMATVKDQNSKSYIVTISMVNLQKSGGRFKRFEVGQQITANGTFWQDDSGAIYITAKKVAAVQ